MTRSLCGAVVAWHEVGALPSLLALAVAVACVVVGFAVLARRDA